MMSTTPHCVVTRFAAVFLALLAWPMSADDIAGKIKGTVTDASGAAVVGVGITARNVKTGVETRIVSGVDGGYSFESLLPATYTVTCEQSGFKRFVAPGTEVIAKQVTTLGIALTVGAVAESIEVSAAATQVDAVNPTIQNTVAENTLLALPVAGSIGRDMRQTAELTLPGATAGESETNGIPKTRVDGLRASTNAYKIDGTESIDYEFGSPTVFPSAENLQEFTVQSNSAGITAGNAGGAQVTAVIKSGTNDLHGMGWTYLTNSGWNANTWANNRVGAPRPRSSQHYYGGNVGGPVYIPKLYNGKNKTFFFFSYEYTKPETQLSLQSEVLTNAERSGDFSSSLFGVPKVNGVPMPQVPVSMFTPLAKALLANTALLPTATGPNGVYTWQATESDPVKPLTAKIDQYIGSRQRLFGTLFDEQYPRVMGSVGAAQLSISNQLPNEGYTTQVRKLQSWTLNHTFTFSPTLVNNFVLGVRRETRGLQHFANPDLSWDKLGEPAVADNGSYLNEMVLYVGSGIHGFTLYGGYDNSIEEHTYYVTDNLSWVKGRHTLLFGFEIRRFDLVFTQNWNAAGNFTFSSSNLGSTGNPFADFLLGSGAAFNQTSFLNLHLKFPGGAGYFQDQIKVNRKLTATVGLRWDPFFGVYDSRGKLSGFRAGEQSTEFPNAPVGMVVPGDSGVPMSTYPNRYQNLAPRVGLAYDLLGNGKMAIRAGYGIYYDLAGYLKNFNNYASSPPYGYTYSPITPVSLADPYNGVKIFPYNSPLPGTSAAKSFTFPATAISMVSISPDFNGGRVHQWNAGYEWEPFKNYLFTASYIGDRGTHLLSSDNINMPIFIPGASTNANQQSRRPYPQYSTIAEAFSGENSRYNALQLTLNRRFAHGFSLLGSYERSRTTEGLDSQGIMGSAVAFRNPYNRGEDYGLSPYDRPQTFKVVYNWDLPFPSGAGKWVKRAFGYWTWGGILKAMSGTPLVVTSPTTFDAQSAGSAWANYVGGSVYGDHSTRASQAGNWLNPLAFCPANAFGTTCTVDPNAGVQYLALGNITRGIARGPGGFYYDMTLSKRVVLSERWGAIEFRAAAFNILNHTVLGNPDTNIADRSSTFGQITSAGAPRSLQLAIRYAF